MYVYITSPDPVKKKYIYIYNLFKRINKEDAYIMKTCLQEGMLSMQIHTWYGKALGMRFYNNVRYWNTF